MTARPPSIGIDGVVLVKLVAHPDERGSFAEVYRREWAPQGSAMAQANLSRSQPGVLRGLHFHREQADYWVPLSGSAFVALYDLRAGSPSEGTKAELHVRPDDERLALYIPPGVAHGFYAETEIELLYLVDRYFTGEDEFGIVWNDPDVGIDWPAENPILSDRDRSNPRLREIVQQLPSYTR